MTGWEDRLEKKERVEAVIETVDGPTATDEVAKRAQVQHGEAQEILDEMCEDGGIARKVGDKYDVDLEELKHRTDPPTELCDNCGLQIGSGETVFEARWERYEGDELSGTGWVRYCSDCAPPGMLSGRE